MTNRKKRVADTRKAVKENSRDEETKIYRDKAFPPTSPIYYGDGEAMCKKLEEQLLQYCVVSNIYLPEQIAPRIQQGKAELIRNIAKFYGMDKKYSSKAIETRKHQQYLNQFIAH